MILFWLQCFKNAQVLDILFFALIIFNPIIFSQLLPVKMSTNNILLNLLICIFILQLITNYLYVCDSQVFHTGVWCLKQTCQICLTFCKHINWEMMDVTAINCTSFTVGGTCNSTLLRTHAGFKEQLNGFNHIIVSNIDAKQNICTFA